MTVIVTVHVPDGIVMAADSRLTRTEVFNNVIQKYIVSDNAQKVFLLKKVKVGILYCGEGYFNNIHVADFLRKFESNKISADDRIEKIAENLKIYLNSFSEGISTIFLVAGYDDNNTAQIFEVKYDRYTQLTKEYTVIWHGEPTAITKLVNGDPPLKINYISTTIKDAVELAEFLINMTISYQRFDYAIATCGGSVDVLVITKDYAHFAKHKILNP
jgi:20S proteasome alpha/beta subunit